MPNSILEEQILARSKEIATDAYSMSVGELISLYRDGELEIHPEFQRFFRWEPEQRSRWIESILLGIPLPSVFMSQTERGKWEVIDGLHRISTILKLVGEFKDRHGNLEEPLVLGGTRYLPELEGKRWAKDGEEGDEYLPSSAQLKIKRARLDVRIVLNTSDPFAKYELFQRLNTGGSHATEQEVRNCILLMVNPDFYEWLSHLSQNAAFQYCLPLSERQRQEQFDIELLVRFLVFRRMPISEIRSFKELGDFLTEQIAARAADPDFDATAEEVAFVRTFEMLAETLGEDSFKRYEPSRSRAVGAPLISFYEVLAIGMGFHADESGEMPDQERVRAVHADLAQHPEFRFGTGSGVRASTRLPVTVSIGREAFAPRNQT